MLKIREVLLDGSWFDFRFEDGSFGSRHFPACAMVVSARDRRTGVALNLQVDTACNVNLIHDNVLPHPDGEANASSPFVLTLEFEGGFSTDAMFSLTSRYLPPDTPDSRGDSDGTLGLALFGNHGFAIDYPEQRLHVLNKAQLNALNTGFGSRMAPYVQRAGSVFTLPILVSGQEIPAYLYTGSGAFQLVLDRVIWSSLTRLPIDAPTVEHFQVPAWGKALDVAGAPVQCEVRLPGGHRLPITMAHTLSAAPMAFANLGNAPFLDAIVVVNFRDRVFGFFPQADPAC